jgi:tetrahydromethanopterin S-methyltransferase subunit G
MSKSVPERLAKIETDISYIKETLERTDTNVQTIMDNHLEHLRASDMALKEEIQGMKNYCKSVQDKKKYGLSGRDKVILYGTILTVIATMIVELIRSWPF